MTYRDLPVDALTQMYVEAELPAPAAGITDSWAAMRRVESATDSGDVQRLIGRPSTPLAAVLADALKR